MATTTEIDSMIWRRPGLRGGRPCIAGTGISVRRIVLWRQEGYEPDVIARNWGHISTAQVNAALAYYEANREEIDTDLEQERLAAEELEKQYRPNPRR